MFAFYTKTRTKGAPVTLTMWIFDDGTGTNASWQQSFQVTWEWKAVQLKAIDFKPYNEVARTKKYVDWAHVRTFQITQAAAGATAVDEAPEFFIDTLRAVANPLR
jgi:hypothetical protein